MAVHYAEFDTTIQNLLRDLKTQILLNPDWTYHGLDTPIATSSLNAAVGATAMTFPSGSIPSALQPGMIVRIDTYASGKSEYRQLTDVTSTQLRWVGHALTYAHSSGTSVFWGNEVFRSTTVRGAQMNIDLTGALGTPNGRRIPIACYNDWTAPTSSNAGIPSGGTTSRFLYWRRSNSTDMSIPLHVVLSSSKDHIYISVEGARIGEPGAGDTAYGSLRSYFFACDLVPYSSSDTIPTYVVGGEIVDNPNSSGPQKSHVVSISKSIDGAQAWVEGLPLSLQFPQMGSTVTAYPQRQTNIDGTERFYLSPYVISDSTCGFRGRLSHFFNAGFNKSTSVDGYMPQVGAELIYNGITYKLMAVSKGESVGSTYNWGPFGAVDNSGDNFWTSPIVAIPIA